MTWLRTVDDGVLVRLLGPVHLGGASTGTTGGTTMLRTIVALLGVAPGVPVSVEVLTDELWGDAPPGNPRGAIKTQMGRLRQWMQQAGLPPVALRATHGGYMLDLDDGEVDAPRFTRLALEVLRAPPGMPSDASSTERALGEWSAHPFGGCVPGRRLEAASVRLVELRLLLLERRAQAWLDGGRLADAVAELRSLVIQHPARERFTALLMIGLHRSNRQQEALGVYQAMRRHLIEEHGLEPSPALTRLERDVLERNGTLDAAGVGAHGSAWNRTSDLNGTRTGHSRPAVELVGRSAELGLIHDAPAKRRIVLVLGEAGSGKSALVNAAAAHVTSTGGLAGIGTWLDDGSTLAAWRDALQAVGVDLAEADVGAGSVRLARQLLALLSTDSNPNPILLVLEDAHQADSASMGLLRAVVDQGLPPQVGIVVTGRDPATHPASTWELALAELIRSGRVVTQTIGDLEPQDVGQLCASRLPQLSPSAVDRVAELVVERSGGHPLHIVTLLDAMASAPDESTCLEVGRRVPALLEPLLSYQLRELDDLGRESLGVLALVGACAPDTLVRVLRTAEDAILTRLAGAFRRRIVIERDGLFSLRHALVGIAVLETMAPSAVQILHRRIAEHFTSRGDVARALPHARRAGALVDPAITADLRLQAGRAAHRTGAHREAATLLAEASAGPEGSARAEDRLVMARSLAALGRFEEAETVYEQLSRDPATPGDLAVVAAVSDHGRGLQVRDRGGGRLYRMRHVALRSDLGSAARLGLLRSLILAEEIAGAARSVSTYRAEFEAAVADASGPVAAAYSAELAARRAHSRGAAGALELAERAWAFASATGLTELRLDTLELLMGVTIAAGDTARAEELSWVLEREGSRAQRLRSRWAAGIVSAALRLAAGDDIEADRLARVALEVGLAEGLPDATGAFGAHLVACRLLDGRFHELVGLARQAVVTYPLVPAWRAALALALAADGDPDAAGELDSYRRQRLGPDAPFDLPGLCLAAEAAYRLDDSGAASFVRDAIRDRHERVVSVGVGAAILGPTARYLALCAAVLDEIDTARRLAGEAERVARAAGWAPWVRKSTALNPG